MKSVLNIKSPQKVESTEHAVMLNFASWARASCYMAEQAHVLTFFQAGGMSHRRMGTVEIQMSVQLKGHSSVDI